MENGKGDDRRLELKTGAYTKGHKKTYGPKKETRPGKTVYRWVDGKLTPFDK